MNFLPYRPLFFCLTVALAFAPAARAATVVNGDFETGDFSGWTLFGDLGDGFVGVDSLAPQAGTYGAYFGPNGATAGISQLVDTIAGAAYDVSFWLKAEAEANGVATPSSFAFSWAGTPVIRLTNQPAGNYVRYSSQVLASTALTSISFTFRNDPAFFDLDSVAIVTSVPEPSSVILLAAGNLAILGFRRRNANRLVCRPAEPPVESCAPQFHKLSLGERWTSMSA